MPRRKEPVGDVRRQMLAQGRCNAANWGDVFGLESDDPARQRYDRSELAAADEGPSRCTSRIVASSTQGSRAARSAAARTRSISSTGAVIVEGNAVVPARKRPSNEPRGVDRLHDVRVAPAVTVEVDEAGRIKWLAAAAAASTSHMPSSSIVARAGRKPPGVSAWPSIRVIADALLSALLSVIMLL